MKQTKTCAKQRGVSLNAADLVWWKPPFWRSNSQISAKGSRSWSTEERGRLQFIRISSHQADTPAATFLLKFVKLPAATLASTIESPSRSRHTLWSLKRQSNA